MAATEETQYTDLIKRILETGAKEDARNGATRTVFGAMMRFSLDGGRMPILTTKRMAWKTCFRELQFFIRGQTDTRVLEKQGVNIWSLNSTREFLDSRGLHDYPEGILGPIYGYQWRHYGAKYDPITASPAKSEGGKGIDQLQHLIDSLKSPETRSSRRHIMTAWNPEQISEMALPPCHLLAQFHVRNGTHLSCALYQRSGDVGLGVPFNIASYSFLTHLLAKHCGLEAEEFVYFLGNAHIYENHVSELSEQIERPPFPFPEIEIATRRERIDDYEIEDIVFRTPYRCHGQIQMQLS
jgi:thymidylate synthase